MMTQHNVFNADLLSFEMMLMLLWDVHYISFLTTHVFFMYCFCISLTFSSPVLICEEFITEPCRTKAKLSCITLHAPIICNFSDG